MAFRHATSTLGKSFVSSASKGVSSRVVSSVSSAPLSAARLGLPSFSTEPSFRCSKQSIYKPVVSRSFSSIKPDVNPNSSSSSSWVNALAPLAAAAVTLFTFSSSSCSSSCSDDNTSGTPVTIAATPEKKKPMTPEEIGAFTRQYEIDAQNKILREVEQLQWQDRILEQVRKEREHEAEVSGYAEYERLKAAMAAAQPQSPDAWYYSDLLEQKNEEIYARIFDGVILEPVCFDTPFSAALRAAGRQIIWKRERAECKRLDDEITREWEEEAFLASVIGGRSKDASLAEGLDGKIPEPQANKSSNDPASLEDAGVVVGDASE